MSEVLHANIFFFITSVAVVLFTLLVCVALYHVVKILEAIRRIVERLDAGSEMIKEDVEQFRSYVREGSLVAQVVGLFMGRRRAAKRRQRETVTEDDVV